MPAIISNTFRFDNSEQFIDSFANAGESKYLFIGRVTPWDDDNQPPIPSNSRDSFITTWDEMVAAKRIGTTDVTFSVPRRDWDSDGLSVYDEYDSSDSQILQKAFYVLTDEFNVYKCISNNNGAFSTVKPTGTGTAPITTADGYVWKFMYTITTSRALKFLVQQHMPVQTLDVDDGSTQWSVQQSAIDGEILHIKITDGGAGYTSATVSVDGDGTGFSGTVNIVGGVVDSITIVNAGSGYRYADVTISGDGTGATGRANISPEGGHGSDAVRELGGYYTTISITLEYDENSDFTVNNDFRTLGIVENPYDVGTTNVTTDSTVRQTTAIAVSNTAGVFSVDEVVSGSTSGATAVVVEYDTTNSIVYVNNVRGTFDTAEFISGGTSGATGDIDTVTLGDMEPYSGSFVYVEQRKPVPREEDQIEKATITIEW